MADYSPILWEAEKPQIFKNPRFPSYEKNKLDALIEDFQLNNHILLCTSGSTAMDSTDIKWVALKKSAFLISAQSVNSHLNCSSKDVFFNALPTFHVGGLALFARAYLCGAPIVDIYHENFKWNSQSFVEELSSKRATISSLVPTQIFDLVKNKCKAPVTLRYVVVGGGFLDKNLFEEAQNLGWPLLPSYGMTECCSQIATAAPYFQWKNNAPELTLLPHVKVTLTEEGKIEIQSPALLTGYIFQSQGKAEFKDPKINGKITTNDIGKMKNQKLFIYGRSDENVKVNGENVSLVRLQSLLERVLHSKYDLAVIAMPEQRMGHRMEVVFHKNHEKEQSEIDEGLRKFNETVFPFERIHQVHFLNEIPRTDLGKLKRNFIFNQLSLPAEKRA